ncbi:hypothetical protein [Xenorhabdus bovienii]|uniref:hypothetical protein n=1 Tax=Xenorhabdus bovienii TaxID=40576 RepID=UPI0023B2DE55|nr:hypothetical protein [Xenorhabdus bovienii]MDE9429864.1 hypothetical protein [Xenorhabdus bovienii]MDE9487544.1 hypothetical protein [Xenorhabdus bovienii]MDE9544120.1 hypothetical protein [Xenorhabdus bovienii]
MINVNDVKPKDLVFFQQTLKKSDQEMADLLGISAKTWVNKRSSTQKIRKQLLSPAECEYFLLLTGDHQKYKLSTSKK